MKTSTRNETAKNQIVCQASDYVLERLEYLRGELRAERISLDELHELQNLARYIAPGDVELLEAAGVPEFPETAGHTPGPWESDWLWQTPEHLNGKRVIDIVTSKGRTIAWVNRWPAKGDESHHNIDDQCEANARLIASAPETAAERDRLREALTLCREYFEGVTEREVGPSSEAYLATVAALAGSPSPAQRVRDAAPELLEACQQAAFAIPTTHGAFETVRAAIARATGGEI